MRLADRPEDQPAEQEDRGNNIEHSKHPTPHPTGADEYRRSTHD